MTQLPLELMTPKLPLAQAFPAGHVLCKSVRQSSHTSKTELSSPPNLPSAHVHNLTDGSASQKARTLWALFQPMSNQSTALVPPLPPCQLHFPFPCPTSATTVKGTAPHCSPPLCTSPPIYFPRAAKEAFPKGSSDFSVSVFCPLVLSPFVLLHAGHSRLKAPMPSGRGLNSFTW